MEALNRICFSFGIPTGEELKHPQSSIHLDLKASQTTQLPEGQNLKCHIKLKAKPGSVGQVEMLVKKLFNPQRRFGLIPSFVYYLLENRGMKVDISTEGTMVTASFSLNSVYSQAVEAFVKSFNSSDFKAITKGNFQMNLSVKGRESFLSKAVNYATLEDDYFFPHLLENSRLELRYSTNPEVLKGIDSLLSHLDPQREFPHLSCASCVDVEAEFDFDAAEITKKDVESNLLFRTVEDGFTWVLARMSSFTERQLKQVTKLRLALEDHIESGLSVGLTVQGLGEASLSLEGSGLLDLLEFVALHPSRAESKTVLSKFLSGWLGRQQSGRNT